MDPILAQGTGVAIEDAYLLSKALEKNYRHISYDNFTITSFGNKKEEEENKININQIFLKENHFIDLKKTFFDFEASR